MISKNSPIFLPATYPKHWTYFLSIPRSIAWTIPGMASEWQVANVTSIYPDP